MAIYVTSDAHGHVRRWSGAGADGVAWMTRVGGRWRPLTGRGSFQLYCNGVQWVTFKFNLKF